MPFYFQHFYFHTRKIRIIAFILAFCTIALCTLISIRPVPARADTAPLLEWQSNNIQLLHGGDFEFSDEDRQTTVTFEHADGWKYGDNFFYLDLPLNSTEEINAEWSPRLSFGKMTGSDLSTGPLQDILLSFTWEKARAFDTFLYGIGLDFTLPGFAFFQTNWYGRDNPDASGTGWQTTWVWSRPFQIGNAQFTFDGYFDFADYEEGDTNFFTQPQILFDLGDAVGYADTGKSWIGLEYRYWHNKYGVDGVNENAPQIMTKWVF